MNTALNRTTVALLTNKSGGDLNYGDVVVLDNTNDNGFTTTTTGALSTRGLGVIIEPNGIANNATGLVALGGWCPIINLNTAATAGQFLKTHTVAGQATPHSSPQVEGDFGVALEASSTPSAILFGGPNAPAGSSGGGAWVLLEQHTASSSATLDFTAWLSGTYDDYVIEVIGTIPATDGTNLFMLVSTDGGSTWSNTGYRYVFTYLGSGGTGGHAETNSGTVGIHIGGTVENTTSTSAFNSTIHMFNPGSTTRVKAFLVDTIFQADDGNYYSWRGGGWWVDASNDVNALRFAYNSGDIAEGTIRIYGIAKS